MQGPAFARNGRRGCDTGRLNPIIHFQLPVMELVLTRQYLERGVNGTLTLNYNRICDTIELPWRNNQRRISCIPEGRYLLRKRYTGRFGWHCRVLDVPGRSAILIHAYNNALKESKGCIAPVSRLTGAGTGNASRIALRNLLKTLSDAFDRHEPVFLTIQSINHETPETGHKAHP